MKAANCSFIGSAKVGWMLKSKLAPGTRCALEHGGVAPAIVAENADLETALLLLVKGAFYHAGQVCVSGQRVYVHESIIGDVADRMTQLVFNLKVGDPADPETEVGPLKRHRETERVEEWVDSAVTGGAKVLCGAKKISDAFYEPTVLLNPPENAHISKTEIFGPVVCLYSYANIEEAIVRANGLSVAFRHV
jgi:acyl-CoA reductase-like NAD-dependent aldehyde dehydrogenase